MYLLKRHPFEIEAFLRRSLVLAFSLPAERLQPLLKPGLTLDTHDGFGFLAVAMVETEDLRPRGWPKWSGRSFFLAGYRLFVRCRTPAGKNLRGLQILRSDADRRSMVLFGSLLTHYRYRRVTVETEKQEGKYEVRVRTAERTELAVTAFLGDASLPAGSLFADAAAARRFAGPMPFTFSYEAETNSILRVEGVRGEWNPRLVRVELGVPPHFEDFCIDPVIPRLASAFYLEDVPYRWRRGAVEKIVS